MKDHDFARLVIKFSLDSTGKDVRKVEVLKDDDITFDFGKKVFGIRKGIQEYQFWIGAFPSASLINSLKRAPELLPLIPKDHPALGSNDHVLGTLDVLFQAGKLFFSLAQWDNELFANRLKPRKINPLLEAKPVEDIQDPVAEADEEGKYFPKFTFSPNSLHSGRYIVITGFCQEIVSSLMLDLFRAEVMGLLESFDKLQNLSTRFLVSPSDITNSYIQWSEDPSDKTRIFTIEIDLGIGNKLIFSWASGLINGPERSSLPNEYYGVVAGEKRSRQYTFGVTGSSASGYKLAAEMVGSTWTDLPMVTTQVAKLLTSQKCDDFIVLPRILRDIDVGQRNYPLRYFSRPLVSIFCGSVAQMIAVCKALGLSSKELASDKDTKEERLNPLSFSMVTKTKSPPPALTSKVTNVFLNIKPLIASRQSKDLMRITLTPYRKNYQGFSLGPFAVQHIGLVYNALMLSDHWHGESSITGFFFSQAFDSLGECEYGKFYVVAVVNSTETNVFAKPQSFGELEQFQAIPTLKQGHLKATQTKQSKAKKVASVDTFAFADWTLGPKRDLSVGGVLFGIIEGGTHNVYPPENYSQVVSYEWGSVAGKVETVAPARVAASGKTTWEVINGELVRFGATTTPNYSTILQPTFGRAKTSKPSDSSNDLAKNNGGNFNSSSVNPMDALALSDDEEEEEDLVNAMVTSPPSTRPSDYTVQSSLSPCAPPFCPGMRYGPHQSEEEGLSVADAAALAMIIAQFKQTRVRGPDQDPSGTRLPPSQVSPEVPMSVTGDPMSDSLEKRPHSATSSSSSAAGNGDDTAPAGSPNV